MKDLRAVRLAKNMSQSELARRANVSQSVVSLLETNDIYPGEELMESLCDALEHDFKNTNTEGVKMTQNQKVLQYMRDHGHISQRDAVEFGCFRLSARIHNLRAAGYHIVTNNKPFRTEYGNRFYADYELVGEALT